MLMFFKSKKILAVGMLLSMMAFAVAGCGGGDKKAEAPKRKTGHAFRSAPEPLNRMKLLRKEMPGLPAAKGDSSPFREAGK